MGSTGPSTKDLVHSIRLSSVVPSRVTGENRVHELTAMDKALKLHYIRGLYLFNEEAVQDLNLVAIKESLYKCLDLHHPVSGRIRRRDPDQGGLVIKCNDGGVRTLEALCRVTVHEWLLWAENDPSINDQLVHRQVIGPDLGFSPLVYVQFTRFKCGGLSIGLSWAHILGDLVSASEFMNTWFTILAGKFLPPKISPSPPLIPIAGKSSPCFLKTIAPVGDQWLIPTISEMGTHTFRFSPEQIAGLHLPVLDSDGSVVKLRPFYVLAAFMWKCLCNLRTDIDRKKIVIVSQEKSGRGENELPSNTHVTIGTVEADFSVAESDLGRLVKLIVGKEVKGIHDDDVGVDSDWAVYGGAYLTFVDAGDVDLYGLELNGQKPVFANYTVAGVGDFGAVLVLPAGPEGGGAVTVTLPVDQIEELKNQVKNLSF